MTLPRTSAALGAALLSVLGPGCLGVRAEHVLLSGTLHEVNPQDYPDRGSEFGPIVDLEKPRPSPLSFTEHGRPLVFERSLELPLAQEDLHYGVVVVDVSPLPAAWRPASAPEGGLVVSAIDRASPLAVAGLRCGDRILSVDGARATTPEEVVAGLQGARARLEVRQAASLEVTTIEADAVDGIRELDGWSLTGVATLVSSASGTGFKLGPLGALFCSRSVWLTDGVSYRDRTEWAALFDLIAYESETDPLTGKSRSRVRLFWFLEFD
ncbi:MAG: PDZ domain-containing protein [Planctomycetota bacterium]